MRLRTRLLSIASFFVPALLAQIASAAPPGPPPKQSSSQFTLRREEAGGPDASIARQRARAGDCAGALPAFDAAIRVTIEPTLRRDRGLCHEKLGDPFPAIEDYRAYLMARADAPDADQIRDRLSRLEEQVGVGGPSSQAVRDRETLDDIKGNVNFSAGNDGGETGSNGSGRSSSSAGSGTAQASASIGPRAGEEGRSYDYYASREKLADQADNAPLRHGTGFEIGPFLMLPRYYFGSGASKDLAYAVGGALRYSWSPNLTFLSELGYAGVGDSGANTSFSGPLLFAGVEYRIPLDAYASNQLLVGGGLGFEHYTFNGTKIATNVGELRGRFGYRHVFGPSVGLEILADGGPAYAKTSGSYAGVDASQSDGKTLGVFGISYALIIGF
jgi:hypothetical protein